jgi:hypothetical protein
VHALKKEKKKDLKKISPQTCGMFYKMDILDVGLHLKKLLLSVFLFS